MNNSLSKKRIAVLFGGRSGEHEVSLASARNVLSVLDRNKYEIFPVGISQSGSWYSGTNVLDQLGSGNVNNLDKVTILPDPGMPTEEPKTPPPTYARSAISRSPCNVPSSP
jgi:D-alanine-D-alanine ligase-like ATP-grasp enzyme